METHLLRAKLRVARLLPAVLRNPRIIRSRTGPIPHARLVCPEILQGRFSPEYRLRLDQNIKLNYKLEPSLRVLGK